jgi:hypothetical protein
VELQPPVSGQDANIYLDTEARILEWLKMLTFDCEAQSQRNSKEGEVREVSQNGNCARGTVLG